jgi:hypothetical protein
MAGGTQLQRARQDSPKFTPLDLAAHANEPGPPRLRSGDQMFAGVLFRLVDASRQKRILAVGRGHHSGSVPAGRDCYYICVAHYCERHPEDTEGPFGAENPRSRFEPVGQHLATYSIVFDDGSRHDFPIRRRFEINPPGIDPSHVPAAARPAFEERYAPLDAALDWAEAQTTVARRVPPDFGPVAWICALRNPHPEQRVRSIELGAAGDDSVSVCAITLFHRDANPIERRPLARLRIVLPEAETDWRKRWQIGVDLGLVARVYPEPVFDPRYWLNQPYQGLGEPAERPRRVERLIAEVTASSAATLTITDRRTKRSFPYDLDQPMVEVLEPRSTWVRGAVIDEQTGKPCAARIAFRGPSGRYIAPYGHPEDINTGWMQNTGPDVKIGGASYAYVDGAFQIELPVGDVYVEVSKGFEYAPVRARIRIAPEQRELRLPIQRPFHTDRQGWCTADTHVHIGAPPLLVLEGAAEGLNLVNLLAAQWGRYFTNFADRPGRFAGSTEETTVWVGSENRQHFLGHIGLLGLRGERVVPFSEAGPPVAYFGAPLTVTLADWADACRAQGGIAVGMHFPIPNGETAVDVVLGKLDAAEIRFDHGFATLGVSEYYRYLNAGYRLAAVGGTDKMFPTRAVGAVRTYARLQPGEPFSFDAWARAVRQGRTFVSCGPLLFLRVDGVEPGGSIEVRGEREVEVLAEVQSHFPAGAIEIVHNGEVVAGGASPLREKFRISRPGWLAARCASRERLPFGMRNIGAHTSPVYLTERGETGFSVPTAQYMLKLIEASMVWVDTLATAAGAGQRQRIRELFRGAQRQLQEKLERHLSAL